MTPLLSNSRASSRVPSVGLWRQANFRPGAVRTTLPIPCLRTQCSLLRAGPANTDMSLKPDLKLAKQQLQDKRFHCTQCGKCCTIDNEMAVWLSDDEARKIAALLGIQEAEFFSKYCKPDFTVPGWSYLAQAPGTTNCVFLEDGFRCGVHDAKPLQCATYPWWPELMPAKLWREEAELRCEGLDHPDAGKLDIESAAEQLHAASIANRALDAAMPKDWTPSA